MKKGIVYASGNLGKFARFEISAGHDLYITEAKRKWSLNILQFNKHVKLQYFESRHSIKSITSISLKRLVQNFILYPKVTFYFLFSRYVVFIPEEINENSNLIVKYESHNKKYYPWVSRLAQLQGVFSITNDQNLDWDMFRYSDRFVCYILERLNVDSQVDSRLLLSLDLPVGSLKIKNITRVSKPNNGELRVTNLNKVIVNDLSGIVYNDTYFPINKFHYQEHVSRPTNLIFEHKERMYVYKFNCSSTVTIDSALLIPYSNNWYHLIMEGVGPYLASYEKLQNLPILIAPDAPQNIIDLLFEISGIYPIPLQPGIALNVGQLSIIQDWRHSERFNFESRSEDIRRIKVFFQSKPAKDNSTCNIFFTRQSNLFRQVTNIEQLQKYLRLKGFNIVDPSQISVEKTKELMSKATTVICETGAAITNLVMCKDKIDFIELNPEKFDSDFWKGFCKELSITHHIINMKKSLRRGSYKVPIVEVDRLLTEIARR